MQTLQLQLPDFVTISSKELMMILASRLFETGTLSLGQAAELGGVSKRVFLDLSSNYGVSVLNYSADEI